MLKSVDLKSPDLIYVNSFLSINGQKISKSLGNVIRPSEIIKEYPSDVVRYYLLKFGPIIDDTDFSMNQLKEIYNGELANGLGNTVSRIFTLAKRANINFSKPESLYLSLNEDFLNFRPDKSLEKIFAKITELNRDINEKAPWTIKDEVELKILIEKYLNEIYYIVVNLKPYMPSVTEEILNSLQNGFNKTNFFPRIS
jgi:methionyl-tRNA synthetase